MVGKFRAIFVLGGPGSGKGTQCNLIERAFNFKHLSAGELLRNEQVNPKSQYGSIIQKIILEGKIVPSFITIQLLQSAMKSMESTHKNFLIDGFPRNLENLNTWKSQTQNFAVCPFILHFQCSQEQMIKRILKRSQKSNRSDDNMQVIRKRFLTYQSQTMDVIRQFQKQGKVRHVNADFTPQEVFKQVERIFQDELKKGKLCD